MTDKEPENVKGTFNKQRCVLMDVGGKGVKGYSLIDWKFVDREETQSINILRV